MTRGIRLTDHQIKQAFDTQNLRDRYPPILRTPQMLDLLGIARSTLEEWIAQGRLHDTYRRRGKHRYFWRDRVIDRIFNGPDWE